MAALCGFNRISFLSVILLLCAVGHSQVPAGFRWVDFKGEPALVSTVERALKGENYTAVREIGVRSEFALVMVVRRDSAQDTPFGDQWTVYNLPMKSGNLQTLVSGYNLEIKAWVSFQSKGDGDLGVVYKHCWECEPVSLFTAFHFDPASGWRARWANEESPNQPGIAFLFTDVGDPFTNEDVDQVFKVLAPSGGVASVGTWYYSRDLGSGKITEAATKFYVDQLTGKDKSVELTGHAAIEWERQLCKLQGSPYGLFQGQSSKACKRLLGAARK
jgi:hypothetical protein